MSLPLVRLGGSPFEQGFKHGRALRERIEHNLRVYFHRFEHEAKLSPDEVLSRAALYDQAIAAQNPDYHAGMRGVAEGGGFDLHRIAALNVRYELLYHQYSARAMAASECTSFAVAPSASANGHLLLGQNWDWIPEVQGALLHTTHNGGLETLAFTEAGIFGGKIGLNSVGIGLAVNGLTSTADDWSRLSRPFHVRCYEVLRSQDFDEAVQAITGSGRACSGNFLLAQTPDRILDVEAAPDQTHLLPAVDGVLTHANHFVDAAAAGITEPPHPRRYLSCHREKNLRELLERHLPVRMEDLPGYLRDHAHHPNGICRHPDTALPPEQRTITVTSVIMDLHDRVLHATDRQPCENEYQRASLA